MTGYPVYDCPDHLGEGACAMHGHFGLSYASYLVLPRLAIQSMPSIWQGKLVALMEEMGETLAVDCPEKGSYRISVRDDRGRFINDPQNNYRHGKLLPRKK